MNDANNAGTQWPTYCHSPHSCTRNLRCMYFKCKYAGQDIGPAIDAAISDPSNRLSTPKMEATTSKMEVVQQREAIGLALRRFHQNSCYPQASDGEIDIAIAAILAVRLDEAAIRKDEREKQREIDAEIADEYAAPNRFSVSDAWKSHSPAEVYSTAAVDVAGWVANAIRNGGKQP